MPNGNRRDAAIEWHIRLSDPLATADGWAAFTDWLGADPENAAAYDAVSRDDMALAATIALAGAPKSPAENDNEDAHPRWYHRRTYLGLAAGGVLAMLASPFLMRGPNLQTFETQPGEMREIALADGSRIVMNGATRIAVDQASGRFARLDAGEAAFIVKHDPAHSFDLRIAGSTLRDLGTIFDVRQDNDKFEVSVAEGAVRYNPEAEALTVAAGQKLSVPLNGGHPLITKADRTAVAGWRRGQLSYQEARLSTIAVDLTRALGMNVSVADEIADRRFTGLIQIEKDRDVLLHRLEALLGVTVRHSAKGWQLTA